MTIDYNPETVSRDTIRIHGKLVSAGYLPMIIPGVYAELWEYDQYLYFITSDQVYSFGLKY